MEKFEFNKTEKIINEEDVTKIDKETKEILFNTFSKIHLKEDDKGGYWEKIIVAGEMALLNIDVIDNLSKEEINGMKKELENIRIKLKAAKDQKDYIDLARCIYRFQNIGLDYPELTDEEKQALENLPQFFRQDKAWHGHLNYTPQIAQALGKNINEISSDADYRLARQSIEEDLQKGEKKELMAMIFSGLLVELNKKEAAKFLDSKYWHEERWQEVLELIKKARENKDGYFLARCLPPFKKLIEFKKNQKP